MKIYESAVRKPISTVLLFVGVMVFGLFSLSRLSVDQYPDRDTAFVNREISALCHDRVVLVGEREGGASVHVLHLGADGSLVNMSLHDMSVQTRI